MGMSNDRVQFVLTDRHLETDKMRHVVARAFGLTSLNVRCMYNELNKSCPTPIIIKCRPSQFARFLIWRNEAGCQNMFQELQPKILPQSTIPEITDVSTNRYCPDN